MTKTKTPKSKRKPAPKPFTVDHWLKYSRNFVLDNGDKWEPEEFEIAFAEDLFAGYRQIWLVIPEGNGKTTLLAGMALYHCDYTSDALVPIGASSREQIGILHNQATGFIRRTPGLGKRFKIYDGYREIHSLARGLGVIKVYAADEKTGDGVIPTLCLLDELHRHKTLGLYRTWEGKLDKRGGQLVAISTGGEPEGEFEAIRSGHLQHAGDIKREGVYIRAASGGMVLHDFALRDKKDIEAMEAAAKQRTSLPPEVLARIKEANPLSTITTKSLAAKFDSPTLDINHFKRMTCNIATRLGDDGVDPKEWDALAVEKVEPSEGAYKLGFLDLGWKIDTTAVGILSWEDHNRRLLIKIAVLEPPVEEKDIVEALCEGQRLYAPEGWVYDPNAGGQQMAQLLENGEHPQQGELEFEFIDHGQSNAPMCLASSRFDEALRNRWFEHDGDAEMRTHVLNAIRRNVADEKYRFDRPKAAQGEKRKEFPIDLLTGILMANSIAVAEQTEKTKKEPLVAWRAR